MREKKSVMEINAQRSMLICKKIYLCLTASQFKETVLYSKLDCSLSGCLTHLLNLRFYLLIPTISLTSYVLAQNKTLIIKSVRLLMSDSLSDITYLQIFSEISEDDLDITFEYYGDEERMSDYPPGHVRTNEAFFPCYYFHFSLCS